MRDKLRVIQDLERPKNVKQLRRFIGMISFYRKFIKEFSRLLYPLNGLLKKSVKWTWTREHQTVFEAIKKAF